MNRTIVSIPVFLMFAFLSILFVYMALPLGQTNAGAVSGVADLRKADLSAAVYQLAGEWRAVSGKLLLPGEFPDDAPVSAIPEKWRDSFESLNTCATYRLTVLTDDTRHLTLILPEIYTAYKLWVNGEYVRGAGVVSDDPAKGAPEFESVIVPVKPLDGKLVILIQASNYHYMRPLMNNILLLGENDAAYSWFFRTRTLYVIALGVFITGAFYHIALYVLHKKEVVYLLFAILSAICFWRYSIDTNGLSDTAGWFSTRGGLIDLKIYMTLFFLHGTAIAAFSLYVFEREWISKRWRWALAYAFSGAALFAVIPWNTPYAPAIVFICIAPFTALALYKAARSRRLRENRLMWLYFVALAFYAAVSVVQKVFFDHLLFMTGLIAEMYLLMAQALIHAKDTADVRESERRLEEVNAVLDHLNRMKTEFFQNLSHDFKTPLTVISTSVLNAADILDYGADKDEMKESLDSAQREIMRMARMVDSAVTNSTMQDNKQDMGKLDIAPLFRDGAETYRAMLERRGNTLTLDIPQSLPHVFGNADTLLHVLSNLLSNSNRHTRNGEITVSAKARGGVIAVRVEDNGDGVSPELLPRVFERGVSDGGTGLGLSICKTAVETHNGTISIDSEHGRGASVEFTLPVATGAREENAYAK